MDLAEAKVEKSGNSYFVTHGSDKGLFAEFSMEPIYQEYASETAGRAVYKDVEHITIIFPADKTKKIFRPVKFKDDEISPSDLNRFPVQWAAFLAKQEQVQDGTPIETWPPMTKSRVLELKTLHIHTIEQVAALTDTTGPNIGLDWRKLRDMAKAYFDDSKGMDQIAALTKQVQDLLLDKKMREEQLAALSIKSEVSEEQTPKRGRPAKPKE